MKYIERARAFRAKKRLGQNFLVDEQVIELIERHAGIENDDVAVEIGAGLGFVTEKIIKNAKKVYAIEIDEDAISVLQKLQDDNLQQNKLEIVHKDVLKTDFSEFGQGLKVIANIPYYITSPILVHLLGEIDDLACKNRNSISKIILMVQKEVAERLAASENSPSKQYGMLSILAQFNAEVKILSIVKAKSFFPSPKVDSAIVELVIRKEPKIKDADHKFLRRVIKICFSSRRKNIKNSLLQGGFSKSAIEKSLENLGIKHETRGETLSVERFNELAKELKANEKD